MSRTFSTNLAHFFDESGAISASLPNAVKKSLKNMQNIVISVTSKTESYPKACIKCWNRIERKACTGKIAASIDLENFTIFWHCLKCGNNGTISQWEQSPWDHGHR